MNKFFTKITRRQFCRVVFVAAFFTMAAAATAADTNHPAEQYVEGEVIVTFKPGYSLATVKQAVTARGMEFSQRFSGLSQSRGKEFGLVRNKNRKTADLIKELQQDATVESAEPNYLRWVNAVPATRTGIFTNLWGLQNNGQTVNGTAGTTNSDIHFINGWSLARNSTNEIVGAVIDTGVDYTHPDIAANIWTNSLEIGGNGVDDDGNGYTDDVRGYNFAGGSADVSDSGYHGTHVAGTIAANNGNGRGMTGVNPFAHIMILRVSSDGSSIVSSAEISALDYATAMKKRGVNVVAMNASFGGGGSNSTERAAIQAAGDAGIIFCAAAGNSTNNNDTTLTYPASYRLTNMIVVAASGQDDTIAYFSNYGTNTVDIAAPGRNIYSLEPLSQAEQIVNVQLGATTYSATALTYSGTTTGLTAAFIDCGLGYTTNFTSAVRGQIALIQRGTLTFSNKVANAMAAGATAAVIYNNVAGSFPGTLQTSANWIPAVSISQADGQAIQQSLPVSGTVRNGANLDKVYQYLDGTSMATPHVVGAVSFAALNYPADTVVQRIRRILTNATPVTALQNYVKGGRRLNLERMLDSNTNGLPDWWETQYFPSPASVNPNADADGDGLKNRDEWLAGTNPTNAASNFRMAMRYLNPTNPPQITWSSVAGKSYELWQTTNLLAGFSTVVRSNITATPPTNSETMPNPAGTGGVFYRVNVEP